MPLVYQQNINLTTRLGVWHIAETEEFFTNQNIPLGRIISHPQKRLQHLAGRYLLKALFPDFPYPLIRIADTRKPFIENELYHFSISHCRAYAAAIVSTQQRVGVDVELFTTKVLSVSHKFMSEAEQQMLLQLAPLNSDYYVQLLTTAWSIKETLFKWYGDGELDFIEHLNIQSLQINEQTGTATCTLLKRKRFELTVHFFYLNGNCVSWLVS